MPVPQVLLGVASIAAAKAAEMAKDPAVQAAAKEAAKKAWDHKDEIRDAAAPVVKKAAEKGAAAGSKAAGLMGSAAAGVAKAAGGVTDSASAAMKESAERRAQEKLLAEARQQLLQSATAKMKAADFEAEWEKAQIAGAITPLRSPGYFVIAVYKGKPNDVKLHDYKDVFVSRSENMGASIHRHLSGDGNPDVYADMKYGQHMLIFAFPDFDFEDDNNETLRQFITALCADASYNASFANSSLNVSDILVEMTGASANLEKVAGVFSASFGKSTAVYEELCGDGKGTRAFLLHMDD